MEGKDLIITPIYLILLTAIAYFIRPLVTTPQTHKYFLPALWARFAGAIALGLIYQYWYGGGDTFNYFTHGSRWIWEAFQADFLKGISLLLDSGGGYRSPDTFEYSQHIWYYRDPQSFFVVRFVAFIDLFTFHTYSATALFFALFGFSGSWAFYLAVVKKYPESEKWLAFAILFMPSVAFWGSGILKDTITLGALGWLTWSMLNIIELGKKGISSWLIAIFAAYFIYSIKVYILICYIPTLFIWIYWKQISSIRNRVFKILTAPLLFVFFGVVAFVSVSQVSSLSDRYSLDAIAERAAITAYDIRYGWGARMEGDGGYDLGQLDGTWSSMIRLMPEAIIVSLFRPFPWEVRNPLMLLSALESLMVVVLTIRLIVKRSVSSITNDPFLVFCLVFSLLFAFAVGVSTFNFGTLMRYKIPMMPFYVLILVVFRAKKYAN